MNFPSCLSGRATGFGFQHRLHCIAVLLSIYCLSMWTFADDARAEVLILQKDRTPGIVNTVYQVGDMAFISAPELFTALGFTFSWQPRSGKLVARRDDFSIVLAPDAHHVVCGLKTYRLESPPRFLHGALCVPVEFIVKALPKLCGVDVRLQSLKAVPPPALKDVLGQAQNLRRIVIDPGHGGHDSGARSRQGIEEKSINLAVALKLRDRLVEDMGVDVVLTRDDDFFIPLNVRTSIGNKCGADLFLSIHANGSLRKEATGLETYFLSFESTDRQAAMLAEEENRSARFEKDSFFSGLSESDDMLAILRDLASTENMKESEKLASAVQKRLVQALHLPNRGVKQAPFFVLVGSRIPAILVEVGFVSNPREAKRLNNPKTQDRIADALYKAILYYDHTLGNRNVASSAQ